MSTNGRTPRFLDPLKTVTLKEAGVERQEAGGGQLEEDSNRSQLHFPLSETADASPASLAPSPALAVLPSVRESEFLPSISRWTTLGGLLAIATVGAAIVLAGFTQYKVTVKAQATIRPAGELRLVQAVTAGTVKSIGFRENQGVKTGDAIATLDDSRLQTQKIQLQSQIQQANLQITQINAQIQALDAQIIAETDRSDRAVAAARAELSRRQRDYRDRQITTSAEVQEAEANLRSAQDEWQRARAELRATEANLKSAQAALESARKRRDRYQNVAQAGALSQDQLDEAQSAAEQQAQTVEVQKANVEAQKQTIERLQQAVKAASARLQRTQAALNPTEAEVAIAFEGVAREKAGGEAAIADLRRQEEALLQQRIALQKQLERHKRQLQQIEIDLRGTKITATADGIIARLNLRNPGQTVTSGEEIAQIVANDASLTIEVAVPPSEISKLQIGQSVQMQVSACPYPDYGTLKGAVSKISQDTTQASEAGSLNLPIASGQKAAFYKVAIAPSSLVFGQGKKQCTLKLGMEGRADIISREETVLQFLLRKARVMADL